MCRDKHGRHVVPVQPSLEHMPDMESVKPARYRQTKELPYEMMGK